MSERLTGWLYCRTRWPLTAVLWRWRVAEADRTRLKQENRRLAEWIARHG